MLNVAIEIFAEHEAMVVREPLYMARISSLEAVRDIQEQQVGIGEKVINYREYQIKELHNENRIKDKEIKEWKLRTYLTGAAGLTLIILLL